MSGVTRERCARLLAIARHDVEGAGRKADLEREATDDEGREAGILGGFDDAGIAHRKRCADRAAEDLRRVVPGNDVTGDAERLAEGHHRVAVEIGQRFAVDLVGGAGIELEIARQGDDVGARLA